MVFLTLPDGSKREVAKNIKYSEVAAGIGAGLARAALGVKVDDAVLDMTREVTGDARISFITGDSEDGLEIIRHSTAHVLAMAVQRLWPGTKVTIGPVIKDGFYYDFEFPSGVKVSEKDFPEIEKTMKAIIAEKHPVVREEVSKDTAVRLFNELGESYKIEIISGFDPKDPITIYRMGNWFDLCRGPHVPSLDKLGVFALTAIAGAYWRGDSSKAMLTRIYGTAWNKKEELKAYQERIEEAKRRDHRVLGKQLDLFSFHEESPANPFFHERGAFLYNRLIAYARRFNDKYGFNEVGTPLLMNVSLWEKSGHYDNYKENMYFTDIDETKAAVKPMNCPGHCLIFSSRKRSYRELPLKLSEFGRVHRHEKSGVVNGLFRVRSFVQDDAHIFCQVDDLQEMIGLVLRQIKEVYTGLGFLEYKMELSTRPEKSIGSDEVWQKAEGALQEALNKHQANYKINPGDGAFYGPKIDFHLVDAIGRTWQCGTVQLDFSMPARFGLEYVGKENRGEQPVMIHRAVLGSIERFLGIFIEHHAGHFPIWAAPVQAQIVNVTKDQEDYGYEVLNRLKELGVRAHFDSRNEKLGYKIREAQLAKVPYMIVIGNNEMNDKKISPRSREGQEFSAMGIEDFVAKVRSECGELWDLR